MIDCLNNKLGGEFARDPGLLPGLLMLVYLFVCAAYLARRIYKSSYGEVCGGTTAFFLVMVLNFFLILAPLWLLSLVVEKAGGDVSEAGLFHFLGVTLVTLAYRGLLSKRDKKKARKAGKTSTGKTEAELTAARLARKARSAPETDPNGGPGRKRRGKWIGILLTATFMGLCLTLAFDAVYEFLPEKSEHLIVLIVGGVVTLGVVLSLALDALSGVEFVRRLFRRD